MGGFGDCQDFFSCIWIGNGLELVIMRGELLGFGVTQEKIESWLTMVRMVST